MANKTMKKVKDNVRKGMAEVGKTAAHLKADAKAEVTRIRVTDTDTDADADVDADVTAPASVFRRKAAG
jgi:hypothetical protein